MNWLSLKEMPAYRLKPLVKAAGCVVAVEMRMKKPANQRFAGQNS